jgi:hypothetical protein
MRAQRTRIGSFKKNHHENTKILLVFFVISIIRDFVIKSLLFRKTVILASLQPVCPDWEID